MEPFRSPDLTDTIIYFSGHQWLPGGNGRHDGLMEALAGHVRVIYAQPPKFSGALMEFPRPKIERARENFWLLHNAFGVRLSRVGRRLGRAGAIIDGAWLRQALSENGVSTYAWWDSCPDPRTHWGIPPERLIYDCIDPCFVEAHQPEMGRAERISARKARVVFATAETLLERMKGFGANAHLLPNGCHEKDYHPSVLSGCALPVPLQGRSGPVVGFMGTVDWRFDAQTVTAAATALPEFTFCIAGRVNADQEARVAELRRLPNTIFPGGVSHEDGVAYTAHCDVAIIPFLPGPMGDAINPCKMYMYMMAGKPIVSTWTRECARHAPYVMAARTSEEFIAAIKAAVGDDSPERRARRTQFAMQNRWEDRADSAIQVLTQAGLFAPSRGAPTGAGYASA